MFILQLKETLMPILDLSYYIQVLVSEIESGCNYIIIPPLSAANVFSIFRSYHTSS